MSRWHIQVRLGQRSDCKNLVVFASLRTRVFCRNLRLMQDADEQSLGFQDSEIRSIFNVALRDSKASIR